MFRIFAPALLLALTAPGTLPAEEAETILSGCAASSSGGTKAFLACLSEKGVTISGNTLIGPTDDPLPPPNADRAEKILDELEDIQPRNPDDVDVARVARKLDQVLPGRGIQRLETLEPKPRYVPPPTPAIDLNAEDVIDGVEQLNGA